MGEVIPGTLAIWGARAEELLEDGVQATVVVRTSRGDVRVIAGLPEENAGEIMFLGASTNEIVSGLTDVWAPEGTQSDWCPDDLLHLDPAQIIPLVRVAALKAWRDARRAAGLWM